MQSIESSVSAGVTKTVEEKNIETLNLVVVGMIAVFAAIMVVNTLLAVVAHRRREFGQQRLAGSTPGQVLQMAGVESLVLLTTGVLFGSVASLVTVIPYSIASADTVVPDATVGVYLAIVGAAAVLTVATTLAATRKAITVPAVDAVAV